MSGATLDEAVLSKWIGRTETARDVIDARPARLMLTILDRDGDVADGDPLPPLWHWLYFPTTEPLGDLGRDGHPQLGGFLPPVDLPRRMWAGGRFTFDRPLRVGDPVERRSTIDSVRVKEGRSGHLCFVTVRHQYLVAEERASSRNTTSSTARTLNPRRRARSRPTPPPRRRGHGPSIPGR